MKKLFLNKLPNSYQKPIQLNNFAKLKGNINNKYLLLLINNTILSKYDS